MALPRYAVFPDIHDGDHHNPSVDPNDYPAWADDPNSALALAEDMAEETGVPHFIMEYVLTVDPPAPVPLEEYNGVRPGVDFPGTL